MGRIDPGTDFDCYLDLSVLLPRTRVAAIHWPVVSGLARRSERNRILADLPDQFALLVGLSISRLHRRKIAPVCGARRANRLSKYVTNFVAVAAESVSLLPDAVRPCGNSFHFLQRHF